MVHRIRGFVNSAADRHRLLTVLVVAVLVSAPGYWRQEQTINKAQAAVDAQAHQTDVARKIACDQANETYRKINGILLQTVAPREGQTRTPEQQAQLEQRIKPYLIELRDCTPSGIRAFYEGEGQ